MSDAGPNVALPNAAPATPAAPPPSEVADDGAFDPAAARAKARETLFGANEPEPDAEEPTQPEVPKPKEKPPEEKPKGDELDLSPKFAKLHAQEKRLKEKQLANIEETKKLEERSAAVEASEKLARENPIEFLGKMGWSKDQIVQWVMSDGKIEPEKLIKDMDAKYQSELTKLREERDAERRALEAEKQQREFQRVTEELDAEVRTILPKYPHIAAACEGDAEELRGLQERVRSIIAEVWQKSQKAVDPADALAYLETRMARLASRFPGRAPDVKSSNPVAVEPNPITNSSQSQRVVPKVEYDETDPEARRARSQAILRGEIDE